MSKISAVIITLNEEQYLDRCLKSLQKVADEIVVVDSFSTDQTQAIAKSYNATIVEQEFLGYVEQKNFAIKQAQHEYILSLDGDEALSDQLIHSIVAVKNSFDFDIYSFNRFNNYCGKWIKHSGWYPDKKNRLFKKGKAEWKGLDIHERLTPINATQVKHLSGDLLHWTYDSFREHYLKVDNFSTISAQGMFKVGKKATYFDLLIRPAWKFFRNYVIKSGFKDGVDGLAICYLSGVDTFLKYFKLYKLHNQ